MRRVRLLLAAGVPAALLGLLAAAPATATAPGAVPPRAVPAADGQCEEGRTQYVPDTPAALVRLAATRAWPLATGKGVTVAVVDSGVATGNRHLPAGVVLDGRSFVGGSARTDARLHGTAIAGIVAARPLDDSGLQGLAKGARVLPVKVVPDEQPADGSPDADAGVLAEGIRWAASRGAQVVNVSLSTPTDDPRLRAAVAAATKAGSLVVASAGTRASDEDPATGVRYPAGYPGVLGVAATDASDVVAKSSVRGAHVDLAAPGVEVLTTYGAWGDCYLSGDDGSTSYATGYVAAAAALVAQRYPDETPGEWAHRLEATASRDRRDARDDAVGWGVVQPVEALTAVLDASVPGPLPPGATPRPSTSAAPRLLAVSPVPDPLAGDRRQVLWVAVAASSLLLGLGLVRLVRRRSSP